MTQIPNKITPDDLLTNSIAYSSNFTVHEPKYADLVIAAKFNQIIDYLNSKEQSLNTGSITRFNDSYSMVERAISLTDRPLNSERD